MVKWSLCGVEIVVMVVADMVELVCQCCFWHHLQDCREALVLSQELHEIIQLLLLVIEISGSKSSLCHFHSLQLFVSGCQLTQ